MLKKIKENFQIKFLILSLFLLCFTWAGEYKLLKAERAEIAVTKNLQIIASYYPVKAVKFPAVILLHVLGRNRGDWNTYARHLQKEGIAVLSIDQRGHGESTNLYQVIWRNFKSKDYVQLISDLASVYDYLVNKGAAPDKIGVLGVSIGANVGINFAARNPKIATVVLVSPGLDYKSIETPEAVVKYGERPLYMLCNSFDTYALQSIKKLQGLAQGKIKVDVYNYRESWPYLLNSKIEIQKAITSWFKESLIQEKKQTEVEEEFKI